MTRFVPNAPALSGADLSALYTAVGWNAEGRRTPEKSQFVLSLAPYFVAAWQGDTLVGFGRVLEDVYSAQLLDIMTHPDFRRRGVAKGVVSRLVRFAEAAGLPLLLVSAGEVTGLYRGFGFLEADPRTDVLMYRPLP